MKRPIFRNEREIEQVRVSRPGSEGHALFPMVFDPERGETGAAVMGVHEHPPGTKPIAPHCHNEVEETVYIVSGEGMVKMVVSYFRNDGRPTGHRLVSEKLTAVAAPRE